jgi:MSHA biogenesis protein MshN
VLGVPDPLPPPPASSVKAETAVPAGPVKIEKSPLAPTARDKADAELRRAETALASGRSGEALDGLRAALKLDPGYVAVRQALLRQLLDARKIDEAMVVLQDGLENMPTQTGWAVSLARLQLEQGDLAGADRTLARSQGYAEANADYAGFQGHVKSRLGAQRQAIAHYQRATRLAPGEGRWWLGLGLAFEADGRLPEARDALRRAIASGTLNHDLAAVAEQHLRQ